MRFDNRDAGRSTHLPGRSYTLEDMADDAAGLLDALGVGSAHVVGASLGGMIGQTMAIRHPGRVRSLASLMSTTGARGTGRTSPRLLRHVFTRPPRSQPRRSSAVSGCSRRSGPPAATGTSTNCDASPRSRSGVIPTGSRGRRRQHRAVRAAGDRTEALRRLTVPTVVVHGTADLMCHPSGGRATAAAVPGVRLELMPGMGHDLPRGAWPRLIRAISDNSRRVPAG